MLWHFLRNRRMNGRKFRRQHPLGGYFLDFYCDELKLALELDGGQHNSAEGRAADLKRDRILTGMGVETLRFPNHEVLIETERVLDTIWKRTKQD